MPPWNDDPIHHGDKPHKRYLEGDEYLKSAHVGSCTKGYGKILPKKGIATKRHKTAIYKMRMGNCVLAYAGLLIEGRLIVELKAVREIANEHVAQIIGYLVSSRMENGLLLNFGAQRLQIKKYVQDQSLPDTDR